MAEHYDIDIILQNYLYGKANDHELELLLDWVNKDPANKEEFLAIKDVWDVSQAEKIKSRLNSQRAFQSFKDRIHKTDINVASKTRSISVFKWAASLLLVAISIFILYFFIQQGDHEILISNNGTTPLTDTLTDKSVVVLGEKTEITRNENYSISNRSISLTGKAFFSVQKNKDIPFVVNTSKLRIEVTGTSFQVNTKYDSENEEVIVKTGQVKVSDHSPEGATIILNAGERLVYPGSGGDLTKEINERQNFISWYTGNLYFDDTPLNVVLHELEDYYSISIRFEEEQFKRLRFTARFGHQPLERILETIEMAYDEYEIKLDKMSENTFNASIKTN